MASQPQVRAEVWLKLSEPIKLSFCLRVHANPIWVTCTVKQTRFIPVVFYFGDYIDNGDPAIQATGMWQAMRQACYDFADAYAALGGNCTVVDLPKEGITGNDHFMFQDLNNDVIANHVENWIQENVQ